MLWIDGSALNQGPKLLKKNVGTTTAANIVPINGAAPTLSNALGIHYNYDVNVLDFATSFFVAMHDEYYRNSVQFYIDATTEAYVNTIDKTVAASPT